jgi:hypothetical protein
MICRQLPSYFYGAVIRFTLRGSVPCGCQDLVPLFGGHDLIYPGIDKTSLHEGIYVSGVGPRYFDGFEGQNSYYRFFLAKTGVGTEE